MTAQQPPRLRQGIPLAINGLQKAFGERQVLRNINLHIPAGQFVAIVGRSGCGKSTLLRLIADLEQPSYGEIKFKSARHLREGITSDDIRVMFQDPRLLPWRSIEQNVHLGLEKTAHPHATALLEKVGLKEKAALWPSQLSGGQRQRTALARALSHQPRVLLLDEPLGALDALTRIDMQDLIVSLWQEHGFTVLLVTHDVSEAVAMADRVLLIEEGKIGLDLTVDIPRPRRVGSARLAELEAEVLDRVMKRGETELQRVKANA